MKQNPQNPNYLLKVGNVYRVADKTRNCIFVVTAIEHSRFGTSPICDDVWDISGINQVNWNYDEVYDELPQPDCLGKIEDFKI